MGTALNSRLLYMYGGTKERTYGRNGYTFRKPCDFDPYQVLPKPKMVFE